MVRKSVAICLLMAILSFSNRPVLAREVGSESGEKRIKSEIQKINGERKHEIIAEFTRKMNAVNQRRVEHWNKVLQRLTEILAKLESKATSTKVKDQISIAKIKIDEAQKAVETQSNKEYEVPIDADHNLKTNARLAMNAEKDDLRSVSMKVNEAKSAVREALFAHRSDKMASSSAERKRNL